MKNKKTRFKSGLYCLKVRGRGECHILLTSQEARTLIRLADGKWQDLQAVFLITNLINK